MSDSGRVGCAETGSREPSLFEATKSLRLVTALTAPEPRVLALTFPNADLRNAVRFTNRAKLSRFPAVHLAVNYGVNRLDVFRTAARGIMTRVVNMFSSRPAKRFVDEPVNTFQLSADPHKTVTVSVLGGGPNPTFFIYADAVV